MKILLIISVLIISVKCGLLDDLVTDEQKSSLTNLLGKKPKASENEKKEYHQGVLVRVVETLENGTKIVIDALGNVIKIHPKDKKEAPKVENPELGTKKPITDGEIGKDDVNKTIDEKPDASTANKTAEEAQKNLNETASTTEDSKKPEEGEKKVKDDSKVVVNEVKNTTEANATADDKTCPDGPCKVPIQTKMALKGDECPDGKKRADDGTCVEEV